MPIALPRRVNENAVEMLASALEMAKRGELTECVVVAAVVDESGLCYFGQAAFTDRWRLLGALQHAISTVDEAI